MKKENLAEYMLNLSPLPEELKDGLVRKDLLDFISARICRTDYQRKDIIHSAGTVCERINFIESGMMRGYKYDKVSGQEKTCYFWDGHTLVTDAKSFLRRKPSEIYIQVLSVTTVQSITYAQLEEICIVFSFLRGFMASLHDHDEKYGNRKYYGSGLKAEEILADLRSACKGIELVATREMIASFIGISRQHLLRIMSVSNGKN